MSNWLDTNGKSVTNNLPNMKFETGVTQVRIVSGVLRRYQYWLVNSIGKKRAFECLRFVRETEKFVNSLPDPVDERGFTEKNEKGETVKLKPKRAYACVVVNRKTGKLELMDLKKSVFDEILAYMKSEGIRDPSSVEFFIEKTGTRWNEVKYKVDSIKTLKFNTNAEQVKALHDADAELIEGLKPIDELVSRDTYEEQRVTLEAFLNATEESTTGAPSNTDNDSVDDLDD